MEIQRRVPELQREVEKLGLQEKVVPVKLKNGKEKVGKRELVRVLEAHYLDKYRGPKENLKKMVQFETPMLAARFTELKLKAQEELFRSPEWFFGEKVDGCRMIIIFTEREGFSFFSRHRSVTDFLPIEYTQNIFSQVNPEKVRREIRSFIVDTEVISKNRNICSVMGKRNKGVITETQLQAVKVLLSMDWEDSLEIQREMTPLQFHLFDVMEYEGENVTGFDFLIRRRLLKKVYEVLKKSGLDCTMEKGYFNPVNKKPYLEKIFQKGGEGVIAKHKDSLYIPTTSRKKEGWVKIKRSASQMMSLGDTIDGWISGGIIGESGKFEGRLTGIEVSSYVQYPGGNQKEEVIARVTGIRHEFLEEMSTEEGELDPSFLGQVVEVDGQSFSPRSKTLTHATLKRIRDDKTKYDCILDSDVIEMNIL